MISRLVIASPLLLLLAFSSASEAKWVANNVQYSNWEESSEKCVDWSPSPEKVEWGIPLRQSQTCEKKDVRKKITTERNKYTGEVRVRHEQPKYRVRVEKKWRTVAGIKDRLIDVKRDVEWSDWVEEPGTRESCYWLYDMPEFVSLGTQYLQTGRCSAIQSRSKQVNEIYLSGKRVRLTEMEEKELRPGIIHVVNTQLGEKDNWGAPTFIYGKWKESDRIDCGDWASSEMLEDQMALGTSALVSRECKLEKSRLATKRIKSLSGKVKTLSKDVERSTRSITQWMPVWGKRDDVVSSDWQLASDWRLDKESLDCEPVDVDNYIKWGVIITSPLNCKGIEKRTFGLVENRLSGAITIGSSKDETRNVDVVDFELSMGQEDELLEKDVVTRISDWSQYGALRCDAYQPFASQMPINLTYTQIMRCEQPEQAYTETLSRWLSGDKWMAGKIQKRISYSYKTRLSTGMKKPTFNERVEKIIVSSGQSRMSKVIMVDNPTLYTQLMVSVNVSDASVMGGVEIVMRDSRGNVITLPKIESEKQNFYYNLAEYDMSSSLSWQVLVTDTGNDGKTKEVDISLQLK